MTLNRIKGFPEYNHASASMTCDGRTLAQLQAAFTTVTNGSNYTFNDAYGWKRPVGLTGDDQLECISRIFNGSEISECTFTSWIDAKVFAGSAYDNEDQLRSIFQLQANSNEGKWRLNSTNDGKMSFGSAVGVSWPNGSNPCINMEGFIPIENTGEPVFLRIDNVVRNGDWLIYVEGIPFARAKITETVTGAGRLPFIEGATWGGDTNNVDSVPPDVYQKDFQIIPQAIDLHIDPIYRRFTYFSDSFGKRSAYDATDGHLIKGNSTDHFGDSTDVSYDGNGISRTIPVLHGLLNLAGYSPLGGRIENYSHGGNYIGIDGSWSADTFLEAYLNNGKIITGGEAGIIMSNHENGWGTTKPDVIFAWYGANNVEGDVALIYQDMFDGWDTFIGEAITAGAKRVICCDCAPTAVEGGNYANAQCEANILAFNQALNDVCAQYPEAVVCPIYERLGGQDNFDANDYSGDRHIGPYGMVKVARWLYQAFIDSI